MASLQVVTVPSGDRAFAAVTHARIRTLFGDPPVPSKNGHERLQLSLRARYPRVVVRPQDPFAARDPGTIVWYAYRDGTASASTEVDRRDAARRAAAVDLVARRHALRDALAGASSAVRRARRAFRESERLQEAYRRRPPRGN